MLKSDLLLQVAIFGMSALTISLVVARIYPSSLFKKHQSATPAADQQVIRSLSSARQAPPTAISIPAVHLNLPIAQAAIVNNQWTLYEDKVSWLATSKTAGQGNVILYAHNRDKLFGSLRNVEIGQEISLQQDGKTYVYQVIQKRKVTPHDVDAVISNNDQLTLYTCDGSFDQKRLIVIALPKSKGKV